MKMVELDEDHIKAARFELLAQIYANGWAKNKLTLINTEVCVL